MSRQFPRIGTQSIGAMLLLLCLASTANSTKAQTADELRTRYPIMTAYQVRPGIVMTAKFAPDGQVCEMTIERRHLTAKAIDLDNPLMSDELTNKILDELVPASERGKEPTGYAKWLSTDVLGPPGDLMLITTNKYQNITVELDGISSKCASGTAVMTITWKKRPCDKGDKNSGKQ